MSKVIPNTFMCFNVYVDRAMHQLTDSEMRVLVFATRHILGWQDKVNERKAHISLSKFTEGFETEDEHGVKTTYGGCGLGEIAVRNACKSLCDFGFLVRVGKLDVKGQEWQLGETPNWQALEARTAAQQAKRQKQVAKATAASVKRRGYVERRGVTFNDGGGGTLNVGSGGTFNDGEQSQIQNQLKSQKDARARMHETVSWAWQNTNRNYIARLSRMLTRTAQASDGKYQQFQVTDPMTVEEVVAFRLWREYLEREMPTVPETIQRTVEEFRGVAEYDRLLEAAREQSTPLNTSPGTVEPASQSEPAPREGGVVEARDLNPVLDALAEKLGR